MNTLGLAARGTFTTVYLLVSHMTDLDRIHAECGSNAEKL